MDTMEGDDKLKHKELIELCNGLWNRVPMKDVMQWLDEHKDNPDLLRDAASYVDEENSTPLHYLLKVSPPPDIVAKFLELAPQAVRMPNERGSIPLHIACNHNASHDVIKLLVDAYPEAASIENKVAYLPLHIAFLNHASSGIVKLLLDTYPESVEFQNKGGDLPLHWAVENGASSSVVKVLLDAYPQAITLIPIETLNILFKNENYNGILNRLELYLEYKPANYEFYCFLQKLTRSDRKKAVLNKHVQLKVENALKDHQLPTFILMLDLYFIVVVIVNFGIAVERYITYLTEAQELTADKSLWFVICGGVYFVIREVIQVFSLVSVGHFSTWWKSKTNYVDVICIGIMLLWPSLMLLGAVNKDSDPEIKQAFQGLSALAAGFLFLLVFSFLKRTFLEFAVFVRGLCVIFIRLFSFLVVFVITIAAFALMLHLLISSPEGCGSYCTFTSSFFEVYAMFLGNIGSIETTSQATLVYALLFILGIIAVVVLLNVLIAVVVDSYGVIKNERSEEVFWSNRLDFITEVVVISYSLEKLSHCVICSAVKNSADIILGDIHTWFLNVFEDKRTYREKWLGNEYSSNSWFFFNIRLLLLLLGFVTAGLFWPPQVRSWIWGRHKNQNEASLKETVQDLKKILSFQNDEVTMECYLKSMAAEIKQEVNIENGKTENEIKYLQTDVADIKFQVLHVMEEVSELKSDISTLRDDMSVIKDHITNMNSLVNEMMYFFKQNQTSV